MKIKIADKEWQYPARIFFSSWVLIGPLLMFFLIPAIIFVPKPYNIFLLIIWLLIGASVMGYTMYNLLYVLPDYSEHNEKLFKEIQQHKEANPSANVEIS